MKIPFFRFLLLFDRPLVASILEAACPFEVLVTVYKQIWCNTLEDESACPFHVK
jgi:hypothetical protein